jgi:hypothetical protein
MDAAPMVTTYAPRERVSLTQTLRPLVRGRLDPTMRITTSGVWRTLLTPAGPASLHLVARGA